MYGYVMELDYCVWIIKIASNLIANLQLTIYSWLSLWDQMMNQWKKNREKNLWWFILTIAMFEGGGQRSFIFLKIFFSSRVAVSPSSISSPFTICMLGKPIIIISTVKIVIWSKIICFVFFQCLFFVIYIFPRFNSLLTIISMGHFPVLLIKWNTLN